MYNEIFKNKNSDPSYILYISIYSYIIDMLIKYINF